MHHSSEQKITAKNKNTNISHNEDTSYSSRSSSQKQLGTQKPNGVNQESVKEYWRWLPPLPAADKLKL